MVGGHRRISAGSGRWLLASALAIAVGAGLVLARSGEAPLRSQRATPLSATATPERAAAGGNFEIQTVPVTSRRELVQELARLGFADVLVLTLGRPRTVQHYGPDHLHAKTTYATPSGSVRVFQSDGGSLTSGEPARVRGRAAVRNGRGASWIERGYVLDINPLRRDYVRALRWISPSR